MANPNRGELEIYIGDQTRTLRFRTAETMLLQKRLEMDPIAYVAKSGGVENFLVEALFCGLSKTEKKLTPMRIAAWLDTDSDIKVGSKVVDREELMKEIIYAIARGKPAKEAEEMVRVLDEAFGEEDESPLPSASSVTPSSSPSTTKPSSSLPR